MCICFPIGPIGHPQRCLAGSRGVEIARVKGARPPAGGPGGIRMQRDLEQNIMNM